MKLVAVTACAAGIAHTYMTAESISQLCKKRGIQVKVETQGCMGPENVLSAQDVESADGIVICSQIAVLNFERFSGYEDKMVSVEPSKVLSDPECVLRALHEKGLM